MLPLCCQGVEIQRVWSLHDVLLSLDYTSEENKQIIDLLLQCFNCPNYIRNDDVSRVVSGCSVCLSLWFESHCRGFVCELSA